MAKILLIGSSSIVGLPLEIKEWLKSYNNQGHSFILGDRNGFDKVLATSLSSVGAKDVTLYCMKYVKENNYNYNTRVFKTVYDETNNIGKIIDESGLMEDIIYTNVSSLEDVDSKDEWKTVRDTQLIKDCDYALVFWDGKTQNTMNIIQKLQLYNKSYNVITLQKKEA